MSLRPRKVKQRVLRIKVFLSDDTLGSQPKDVKAAIAYGEIIEEMPDDEPFPSCLILDFVGGQPVHVVLSQDVASQT